MVMEDMCENLFLAMRVVFLEQKCRDLRDGLQAQRDKKLLLSLVEKIE